MGNIGLSAEQLRHRGYFDAATVRRFINPGQKQQADYSEHVLALLIVKMWRRILWDGD